MNQKLKISQNKKENAYTIYSHICANICGKVSSSAKYKTLTTLAQ